MRRTVASMGLLSFVAGCLFFSKTPAQESSFPLQHFGHITSDQGLSNRNVTSMMKDSRGFMWIGTIDGLNRYDGYDFRFFRNDPRDSTSISFGWPMAMAEDKNGIIWIACSVTKALNAYNPNTGKFTRYGEIPYYKNLLPDNIIYALYVDQDNKLWMGTEGQGVYVLDQKTHQIKHYSHDSHDASSFGGDTAYALCAATDGNIYAAAWYGFDLINTKTGLCTHYHLKRDHPNDHSYFVNSLFSDNKNQLWICTLEGLKCFNPLTEKFSELRHQPHNNNSLSNDSTVSICETPDGRLWIRTNNGLDIYDQHTKKFVAYFHSEKDQNSISSIDFFGRPYYSSYDRSGILWLKSEYSIDYLDLLPDKFSLLQSYEKNGNSLITGSFENIYEDHDGKIFICTSHGIVTYDAATKKLDRYQPDPSINYLLRDREVDIIFQDREGNYWIEVDLNKLISYNPQDHRSRIYHFKQDHAPDSLGVGFIWNVYEDESGIIWFGGDSYLSAYNPETKKFKSYLRYPDHPNMFENGVNRIMQLDDGRILFAASGISYYDPKPDKINILSFPGSNNASLKLLLQSDIITSLNAGNNKLWLGTMGNGLFFFDAKTGACRNFTAKDGLPNDVIWGILKDGHGNLWLPTNGGICRFTPPANPFDENEKESFRNYNIGDGIPIKEFGWNAYLKAKDGTMYFGMYDSKGRLVYFHPDSLKDNPFVPSVYITDFKLFNKSVDPSDSNKFLKTPIDVTKEITLSYRQNVISFTFAALSFVHPEKNQYAYKLDNFDKDWIYTDASKRFANYTNLDAGAYTFEVKGSNNDGVWNEIPATLKLIITPPYWETWWFKVLVGATIAVALYALYRFRMSQIIRLNQIRNKIAHDLHDDIGSTLNSISVYSELVKKDPSQQTYALDMIGASSRKVIDAMGDIVWTINPENDSIEKIILRMRALSYNLLRAKKIEYTFRADEEMGNLKLSMEKRRNLFLIFKEVLNNVIKYSEAKRSEIRLSQNNGTITLLIRDDGVGFDPAVKYNGNGLNSMRQRAKEMNAKLNIESGEGNGTSVELIVKA